MLNIRFQYKLEDFWIGAFWRKSKVCVPQGAPFYTLPICDMVEVWICLIPCLPIHIRWVDTKSVKASQLLRNREQK